MRLNGAAARGQAPARRLSAPGRGPMDAGSANSRPPRFERGCAGASPAPAGLSIPDRLKVGRGALNAEMVVRCHLREPRRLRERENPAACKADALRARQGQHLELAPRKGSEDGEDTVSKTAGRASGLWDRHPPLPPVLRGRPGGRGGPLDIKESRRITVRRAGLLSRSGLVPGGGSIPSLSARFGTGPRSRRMPHRDKSGFGGRPAAPAASGLGIRTVPPMFGVIG